MAQDIEFDIHDDGTYHIYLDGEDKGAVDKESLSNAVQSLYMHFVVFRNVPDNEAVPLPNDDEVSDLTELSDEDLEAELDELSDELDDV